VHLQDLPIKDRFEVVVRSEWRQQWLFIIIERNGDTCRHVEPPESQQGDQLCDAEAVKAGRIRSARRSVRHLNGKATTGRPLSLLMRLSLSGQAPLDAGGTLRRRIR